MINFKKNIQQKSLLLHEKSKGNLKVSSANRINRSNLKYYYSPGIGNLCNEIKKDSTKINIYTSKPRTVAVLTNGSAVLGYGDIGPDASLPVMEAKSAILAEFGNLNAFPLCVKSHSVSEIIKVVSSIQSSIGGIMIEDVKSPEAFDLFDQLQNKLKLPIIHDDRHSTAIIIIATLINACRVANKKISNLKICFAGLGSAATGTIELLNHIGVKNIVGFDERGVLCEQTLHYQNKIIQNLVHKKTIKLLKQGATVQDALKDQEVFIGLSTKNVLKPAWIKNMAPDPWILSLANPKPEIHPSKAFMAGAQLVGTGIKSANLKTNYVNNVLVFPGLMKTLMSAKILKLTPEISLKAAYGVANVVKESKLSFSRLLPKPLDNKIASSINYEILKFITEESIK